MVVVCPMWTDGLFLWFDSGTRHVVSCCERGMPRPRFGLKGSDSCSIDLELPGVEASVLGGAGDGVGGRFEADIHHGI